MTPKQRADKLDAKLKDQEVELVELQSNVAENKEAGQELNKTLENLEAVTQKLEEKEG
jgi:uncharacterized coiled-coil protein SlyX